MAELGGGRGWIGDLNSRTFGEVWIAKESHSDVPVAIKRVRIKESVEAITKGFESLKNCVSPFVVRYSNFFHEDGEVWVSFIWMPLNIDGDGVLPLRFCV